MKCWVNFLQTSYRSHFLLRVSCLHCWPSADYISNEEIGGSAGVHIIYSISASAGWLVVCVIVFFWEYLVFQEYCFLHKLFSRPQLWRIAAISFVNNKRQFLCLQSVVPQSDDRGLSGPRIQAQSICFFGLDFVC